MGVTLPDEMRGSIVTASKNVGVQNYVRAEAVVLGARPMPEPNAKVETIAMLIASGAAGIPAQDATAGLLAMQVRSQDGHDKDAIALGQALQVMGLNPPTEAHNVGSATGLASQKGSGRGV